MQVGQKCKVVQNNCDGLSPVNKGVLAKEGEVLTVVEFKNRKGWYDNKHNYYDSEVSYYCADGYLQFFPCKDLQVIE